MPSRWVAALAVYLEPRLLAVLCLGFASGLPLALTGQTLQAWLTEDGLSLGAIGLFAAVGTPYTLKFLWAPLVDQARLPLFSRLFGRRRSWLIATQIVLIAAILLLGAADPRHMIALTAIAALLVAIASATQDIVIDAWRVEMLDERRQGAGAAMIVFGYRLGMLASGAGALYLASATTWFWTYAAMAALLLVGVAVALLGPEPEPVEVPPAAPVAAGADHLRRAASWLYTAAIAPFAEFLQRPGWLAILAFAMLFKLGDSLAGVMATSFYLKLGFSKIDIANVAKLYGFFATLLGLFLGGWLMNAVGLVRALWVCGFLQLGSNLLFAALAQVGPDLAFLSLTVGIENLTGGMGTAALVAYLSSLCNLSYTATQYALLSSFTAVARTWLSSFAGYAAEYFDWFLFFTLTAVAALPGLALLWWLTRFTFRPAAPPA